MDGNGPARSGAAQGTDAERAARPPRWDVTTLFAQRRFKLALLFAIVSLATFVLTQLAGYHREAWLGVVRDHVPSNISFNVGFLYPATALSTLFALVALVHFRRGLWELKRLELSPSTWQKAAILPAAPVLMFDLLLAISLLGIAMDEGF
jgi:hypothetical protein